MAHIFISYSREDLDFARYLRALLEKEGFAVWMDEKRLSAGMTWWKEIERSIDRCDAFIVVMSPASDESMYVHNEILRALDQKKPIFPVLLRGNAFSLLASVQFEDMRAGLGATPSGAFFGGLRHAINAGIPAERRVRFEIVESEISEFSCDVLLFKYAQGFHGADSYVAKKLRAVDALSAEDFTNLNITGDYRLFDTKESVAAKHALYVCTPSIYQLGYREIRQLSVTGLRILGAQLPDTTHIASTIHGVRTSRKLDEGASLQAQIAGLIEALQSGAVPSGLERISIVDYDPARVERLRSVAAPYLDGISYAQALEGDDWGYDLVFTGTSKAPELLPEQETVKPYAVVIIPDNPDLDDVFFYGIQRPVHAIGLLCERALSGNNEDLPPPTVDDLLAHLRSASVVVADVSDVSPRLYLQVGYALGRNIPVKCICRGESSEFDAADVIYYDKIWQLEEYLSAWLKTIADSD